MLCISRFARGGDSLRTSSGEKGPFGTLSLLSSTRFARYGGCCFLESSSRFARSDLPSGGCSLHTYLSFLEVGVSLTISYRSVPSLHPVVPFGLRSSDLRELGVPGRVPPRMAFGHGGPSGQEPFGLRSLRLGSASQSSFFFYFQVKLL